MLQPFCAPFQMLNQFTWYCRWSNYDYTFNISDIPVEETVATIKELYDPFRSNNKARSGKAKDTSDTDIHANEKNTKFHTSDKCYDEKKSILRESEALHELKTLQLVEDRIIETQTISNYDNKIYIYTSLTSYNNTIIEMKRNEYQNKSNNSLSNVLSFNRSQTQLLKLVNAIRNIPSPNIIKNMNNAKNKRRDSIGLDMYGNTGTIGLPNNIEIVNIIKDITQKNIKLILNTNVNNNKWCEYKRSKLLEYNEFNNAWIIHNDVSTSL